jgi:uncharacterized protein (DUF952 family)
MYVEITKEVFDLIRGNVLSSYAHQVNGVSKEVYHPCDDTVLMVIHNHNGTQPQYFIRDINA